MTDSGSIGSEQGLRPDSGRPDSRRPENVKPENVGDSARPQAGAGDRTTAGAGDGGPPGGGAGRRRGSSVRRVGMVLLVLLVLCLPPWWSLFASADWPLPVFLAGTVVLAAWMVSFPFLMVAGHGRRRSDRAARIADTSLGMIWVLFTWSVPGGLAGLVLMGFGVGGTGRARAVSVAVAVVSAGLLAWGHYEAMRVPRVKRLDVGVPRLGGGLDGTRVVVLADTHYGPIDRAGWSARVTEAVNALDADVVVHAGDIADGTPVQRREQSAPLGAVRSRLAKVYVTGNHEYGSEAQGWLDRMAELGWEPLHNRHVVVERGGDSLVLAGVDDVTAESSGLAGHSANLLGALAGTDPDQPVLLVAHQPKFVPQAAAAGIDLQISGHTHGGQIWPFNFLVRIDQPVVSGLSRHGARTQLYTSRGTGFWGPPFRVFAPSEITLLTLRAG
ncbi:metallophosphoesterase [Streptomyces sp. ITFR-6]|uniref:metallophosphoesterase n=1 Tax=Streptomyces sp. ITFR-6 TaxID=3075197 RepID=UPI00288A08F5|nr:metallophosphoesterase [Streptomyces sp. ITFR-6]WNI30422.1 metallophosphoesterase [Streptomyces sp. ITFR-6]